MKTNPRPPVNTAQAPRLSNDESVNAAIFQVNPDPVKGLGRLYQFLVMKHQKQDLMYENLDVLLQCAVGWKRLDAAVVQSMPMPLLNYASTMRPPKPEPDESWRLYPATSIADPMAKETFGIRTGTKSALVSRGRNVDPRGED